MKLYTLVRGRMGFIVMLRGKFEEESNATLRLGAFIVRAFSIGSVEVTRRAVLTFREIRIRERDTCKNTV